MKKAFTLIELIGVLVIIGLVTLVVSVLVMGIIRRTKYEANKRSIEAYARVVELAMDTYQSEHLKYPESFDELVIEYTGSKVECEVSRINPDYTIYLDECKVNGKNVDYQYGTLVLTDKEYVDKLGKNIELALKDYHDEYNKYPINYRLLELPELDKDVKCASEINSDGTVYLTKCTVDGVKILDDNTEDGYYHYGKQTPTAVKYLLKKTNGIEITNYTDGNTHEMYTFEHEATEQTPALTDYRYIGSDPHNYVTFNGDELWRIIGVFSVEDVNGNWEERVKLIRDESLGIKQWNSNNLSEWVGSTLGDYLNVDFYDECTDSAKNMIADTKYYLGNLQLVFRIHYGTTAEVYAAERNINVYSGYSTNWIGKIGLMYPSDYLFSYALGVDDVCYNDGYNCRTEKEGFPTSGWLYSPQYNQWTLVPMYDETYVSCIGSTGLLDYYYASFRNGVVPVVYLKPNVKILSGDGTIDNPYQLSL